ncbi:MAG TPA: SRPBCC domain-containing protein [Dongiaceae bacterium]
MPETAQHELVITRTFDAPRPLVFKAWTQAEHMVRWFGPRSYTAISAKMDVRPGGAYRAGMRSPDGKEHWMRGTSREIVEPERLVFTFSWEGKEGEMGRENTISISFADVGGKTRMTFRQAFFETAQNRDEHGKGWNACFDHLADFLADEQRA